MVYGLDWFVLSNMSSGSKTVVWFRRDLRIEDNPALATAAKEGSVLPVFIWCPKEEGQFYPGRVSRWWLKQSLVHLKQSLRTLGADLLLIKAESTIDAILDCINTIGATKLVYNHLYGMPWFLSYCNLFPPDAIIDFLDGFDELYSCLIIWCWCDTSHFNII